MPTVLAQSLVVMDRIWPGMARRRFQASQQAVDDGVVAVEDAGVEEVVLEELPQILDRIEFGAVGRQWQQA